jgi:phage baseplate assembly protein W
MADEFLGNGWSFPIRTPDDTGEIITDRDEEKIRQSIEIILGTSPGERLMRPDFGCGIHDYVFAPNNVRTAGLIRFHVEEALNRWEPRIDLEEVTVAPDNDDPAVILIVIAYRIKSTDSRFNMVYPFYLERGGAI